MDYKKETSMRKLEKLSPMEQLVYHALSKGNYDTATIAKECNLTDLQVKVVLQLLEHKKMLPSKDLLS